MKLRARASMTASLVRKENGAAPEILNQRTATRATGASKVHKTEPPVARNTGTFATKVTTARRGPSSSMPVLGAPSEIATG